MTPFQRTVAILAAIGAAILASVLFAHYVAAQQYTPDHIDIERNENWRAMRSHKCYWYGTHCPGDGWRRHYRSRHHHYYRPDPNPEIKWAQQKLRELGYEIEDDGLMGPRTRDAIRDIQVKAGLPATGELGEKTWEALSSGRGVQPGRGAWTSGPPRICTENRGGEIRHCACDAIAVTSAEHIWKDAQKETMRRWRGAVRSLLGELFTGWKHAANKVEHCWNSGTGERASERAAGQYTRCVRVAHPCWGVLRADEPDEFDDAPPPRKGRDD